MLEPQSRRLFLDSLRPPDGYALDYAVGTTFSLDLLALLSVPLAFTFSDWEDSDGQTTENSMALLESIKRHADKICIFCQAGQISVPKKDQRLFAYLEQSVFEVTAKKKFGVFHPKIWLLRFTSKLYSAVRYRFICLSRNLTYDRSWDTVLVMDGVLQERKRAYAKNHPLGDFIAALPGLTLLTGRSVPAAVQNRIDSLQDEVRRVLFELPSTLDEKNNQISFEDYQFWPLGLNSRPDWPFDGTDDEMAHRRMLIVSPFLSDGLLRRITRKRKKSILVSRSDEAEQITKDVCSLFETIYTLAPEALPEDLDTDLEGQDALSGLHAKLFLMDDGHKARLWTGSANATNAAFPDSKKNEDKDKGNIEFLVELSGSRKQFGIDHIMSKRVGAISFSDLLEPFTPPDQPPEVDKEQKNIEDELDNARRLFACRVLRAVVSPGKGVGSYSTQLFTGPPLTGLAGIIVNCWPVTFQEHLAISCSLQSEELVVFSGMTLDAITAFFAFELVLERSGKKAKSRFVVKADLEGVPEGRFSFLLRSLLNNRNKVLQMLLMLLADQDAPVFHDGIHPGKLGANDISNGSAAIPLLESILWALDRDPEKIDRINALVCDLMATEEGTELLPKGFNDIWPAIWAARGDLK
ncbi:MAG: phospholipase D family protein [Chlorobium sp.]|nr:phospholipase D family protein [Chlorobium sp.]